MAATPTYTDEDLVRARAKNIGEAENPSDIMINEYIVEAEGLVDAYLGFSLKNSFDETKPAHLLIRQVTTDIAAFYAIAHCPTGFPTTSEAALVADLIYTNLVRGIRTLKDTRIRKWIQNTNNSHNTYAQASLTDLISQ